MTKPQPNHSTVPSDQSTTVEPPEPAPEDTAWATMEEIRKADERDYERR